MQTKVSRPQDVMMMTEPPPSQDARGSTSQWEIFDAYKAHQDRSRAAEDPAKAAVDKSAVATRKSSQQARTLQTSCLYWSAKLCQTSRGFPLLPLCAAWVGSHCQCAGVPPNTMRRALPLSSCLKASREEERAAWLQEEGKHSRPDLERVTQLVQRMCNQNLQHDLISDFKACADHVLSFLYLDATQRH